MDERRECGVLEGRRGLVLGVSSRRSAGYACAAYFRQCGARVAVSSRSACSGKGSALAEELGAVAVTVDATVEASFESALREVQEKLGGLDFVVHTLVAAPRAALQTSVLELGREDFAEVMDVGVRSFLVALRFAMPALRLSSAPRVVALSSAGSHFAIPNYHAVGLAKAALEAAIRYAAAELGRERVLCNGISFSMTPTEAAVRLMGEEVTDKTVSYLARHSMTGQAVTLEDVAAAAAFLVSDLCRNLTGQVLTLDGGYCSNYF